MKKHSFRLILKVLMRQFSWIVIDFLRRGKTFPKKNIRPKQG